MSELTKKIYAKDKSEFERFYRTLSGFVFHRENDNDKTKVDIRIATNVVFKSFPKKLTVQTIVENLKD